MRHLAIYGACAGLLIVAMRFVEYRFLVVERTVEIYGALIAAAFAALGIWLGLTLTRREVVIKEVAVAVEVPVPAEPFRPDTSRIAALGLTRRELEVLQLIADGLSTKEMAERLFVSENTVKTHTSRVFDKLGASRRTQAVQLAKRQRIIA
ncbi:MAG TPA: response regulator transcription factor [Vicinamibacterales bacterium]|nr:response regulator transcription factor [Vicinamibacterales bacterium]